MALAPPPYLYLLDEDLYRLGNLGSPNLHKVRHPKYVHSLDRWHPHGPLERQRHLTVTEERLERERAYHQGSYAWKAPAYLRMPNGFLYSLTPATFGPARYPTTVFVPAI